MCMLLGMKMNIITIISDEHSYQAMGNSGSPFAETPNLDRLASNGINFRNAYSPCPVCAPARASWFTGQYVCHLGTWDNSTPYDGTQPGIASHLGKHGVPVHHIGKTHFHPDGDYGFASIEYPNYLESPDLGCYYRDKKVARLGAEKRFSKIGIKKEASFDDKVIERALQWIDENKDNDGWALNIGLLDPHFPFYVKQEHWNYFADKIKEIPVSSKPPFTSLNNSLLELRKYFKGDMVDDEILRKVFIGYHAAIKELDDNIGLILNKLEETGLLDDTIVIYTSDHGEQLGYHGLWWKCTMFEQSARIPMIILDPTRRHRDVDVPVNLVDLFPTMCEIFGIPFAEDIDGQSLLPLMNGTVDNTRRDYSFSEYNAHGISGGMYMIRWDRYKYVFYTNDNPQLFDLSSDPGEDHDLVSEKGDSEEIKLILAEGQKRLYSVCNPYRVTERSLEFQARMKKELNLPDEYDIERSFGFVPHPEYER